MAVSHCSSMHTRNLPETGLPTSSHPKSLPYAARISFFIPYFTADQHLKLLLRPVAHAYESWTKWLQLLAAHPSSTTDFSSVPTVLFPARHLPKVMTHARVSRVTTVMWTLESLHQAINKMVFVLCALNPLWRHEDSEPPTAWAASESLHSPAKIDVNVRHEPQWSCAEPL